MTRERPNTLGSVRSMVMTPAAGRAISVRLGTATSPPGPMAFTVTVVWRSVLAGVLVPGILFSGGIGAFVQTYRVWRVEGVWPIWQAAGWVLLLLFLVCLSVPFAVAA